MEFVKLNNGVKMPAIGYGTWDLRGQECVNCVSKAIQTGYRLIDTAVMYDNEREVGKGMKKSGISREEIFLTTKLDHRYASYEKAKKGIDECLKNLQADYIDLLLVHEPYAEYISMYQALEEAYAQGKIRAIGISNINRRLYDQLLSLCKVVPMVNQVESHVYYPQLSYQKYLQEKGTVMESWAPFTEGRRRIFAEPVLMEIAQKYQKTVGQIALKYLSQNGIIVIPKTAKEERMKENISLFGFSLDESDLHQIRKLDEGKSLFGWYEP